MTQGKLWVKIKFQFNKWWLSLSTAAGKLRERTKHPILWEVLIIFFAIVLCNRLLFPEDPGFNKLHQLIVNPFLFFILIIVIRYGISWGLLTTLLSSAYLLLIPPYDFKTILSRLPVIALYFSVLMIFGQLHEKSARKISKLNEELEDSKEKYQSLNERYETTLFLKENYEKKILSQTTTMADLYRDAQKMQELNTGSLFEEILNLTRKYVEAQKCCLYIIEDDMLKLRASIGYFDYEEKPKQQIRLTEDPYRMIIEKKELISITESQFKQSIISKIPVYMGPIKTSEGEMLGILTVNTISLLKFNQLSRKTFSLICDWVSKAIENAISYKVSEAKRIMDPECKIFRLNYFLMRLEESIFFAKRTGFNFYIFIVTIQNWENIIERYKKPTLKFISRIIGQIIGEMDILSLSDKENELMILMSEKNDESTEDFLERLNEEIKTFNLKPFKDDSSLRLLINYTGDFQSKSSPEELIKEAVESPREQILIPKQDSEVEDFDESFKI